MSRLSLALFALLTAGAPAGASTIFGNPILEVVLDSGASVELIAVRGDTCPDVNTDTINETLSVGTPVDAQLPAAHYHELEVLVRWVSSESVDVVQVADTDDLALFAGQTTRTITLDPVTRTASLD